MAQGGCQFCSGEIGEQRNLAAHNKIGKNKPGNVALTLLPLAGFHQQYISN